MSRHILVDEVAEDPVKVAYGRPMKIGSIVVWRVPLGWKGCRYQMQYGYILLQKRAMIVVGKSASGSIQKHFVIALQLARSAQCLLDLHETRMQPARVLKEAGKFRIARTNQIKQHKHLLNN